MKLNAILDELGEVKKKVLFIFITVVSTSLFALFFDFSIIYPNQPSGSTLTTIIFNKLKLDLLPQNIELIAINPADALVSQIEISLFIGCLISLPVTIYQIASLVFPALYRNEKRFIVNVTIPALLLFVAGSTFAYFLILPFTFEFFYGYALAMGAKQFITIDGFVSYILLMMLSFGLTFMLLIVMVALTKIGLVGAKTWKENFGVAVVVITIFSGVITPDASGITQILVMAPLIFLYLLGYYISKVIERDKRRLNDIPDATADVI